MRQVYPAEDVSIEPLRASFHPGRRGRHTLRSLRRRLGMKEEFLLAALPTFVVLSVFGVVEHFTQQRLLFASLASSAFLIYLDPEHGANQSRTLVLSQLMAAVAGFAMMEALGPGYTAFALSMVATITLMVLLDAVHPPAVSTALSFAFKSGPEGNIVLFSLAVGRVAVLIFLEKASVWLLARFSWEEPDTARRAAPGHG